MWSVPESHTDRVDWPEGSPGAWDTRCRAVIWWHRATEAGLTWSPGGPCLPLTVAGLVDYSQTPVGPYHEIFGAPVLRRPGVDLAPRIGLRAEPVIAVPFIAVDSERSVRAGRDNWNLPKVLADFDGDLFATTTVGGDGWQVRTTVRAYGPPLPYAGTARLGQPLPDGGTATARLLAGGLTRVARIKVEARGPSLDGWLRTAVHNGVIVDRARLRVGAAH